MPYLFSPYDVVRNKAGVPSRVLRVADALPSQRPGETPPWAETETRGDGAIVYAPDVAPAAALPGVVQLGGRDQTLFDDCAEMSSDERADVAAVAEQMGYRETAESIGRSGTLYRLLSTLPRVLPRLKPRRTEHDEVALDGPPQPQAPLPLPRGAIASFPRTPIIDEFDQGDETPVTDWPTPSGWANGDHRVVSNSFAANALYAASYYSGSVVGGENTEFWADNITVTPGEIVLYFRVADESGATPDGYNAQYWGGTPFVRARRTDDGVDTALGANMSISTNSGFLATGDAFGGRAEGSSIQVWHRYLTTGNWTLVGSRTDTTYTAAGSFRIYTQDTTGRISSFGGGEIKRPLSSSGAGA